MQEIQYKVGDRVRCIKPAFGVKLGELGTVCYAGTADIGVRWDIKNQFQRHNCGGRCEDGHSLWHYPSHVEPYIEEQCELGEIISDAIAAFVIAGGF